MRVRMSSSAWVYTDSSADPDRVRMVQAVAEIEVTVTWRRAQRGEIVVTVLWLTDGSTFFTTSVLILFYYNSFLLRFLSQEVFGWRMALFSFSSIVIIIFIG